MSCAYRANVQLEINLTLKGGSMLLSYSACAAAVLPDAAVHKPVTLRFQVALSAAFISCIWRVLSHYFRC